MEPINWRPVAWSATCQNVQMEIVSTDEHYAVYCWAYWNKKSERDKKLNKLTLKNSSYLKGNNEWVSQMTWRPGDHTEDCYDGEEEWRYDQVVFDSLEEAIEHAGRIKI